MDIIQNYFKKTDKEKELKKRIRIMKESVRYFIENSLDKTKPTYWLYAGLTALSALTGIRAHEILPNPKDKTYMSFQDTMIKTDENGVHWIHIPITLKRREKHTDRYVPLLDLNKYPEEKYLFSIYYKFLEWRKSKEAALLFNKKAMFGAGHRNYKKEAFIIKKEDLIKSKYFQNLSFLQKKHLLSLRKWYWIWKNNKQNEVLFPVPYYTWKSLLTKLKFPVKNQIGEVIYIRPWSHIFRKWRVSTLLMYGYSTTFVKEFLNWKSFKSLPNYISMREDILVSELEKI